MTFFSLKEMTSSNECPSEGHQGTEDPSNCFLPPDPHPVHSITSNIDGIIFDPHTIHNNGNFFKLFIYIFFNVYRSSICDYFHLQATMVTILNFKPKTINK